MRAGIAASGNGLLGVLLLLLVLAVIGLGPLLTPDPLALDPVGARMPPSASHLFGTDEFGRDVLARVAAGGRKSVLLAVLAVAIGLAGGLLLGTFGPLRGGTADRAVVVLIDALFSFPPVVLALLVAAALGAGVVTLGLAVGLGWVPYFGRLVRGQVLTLRQRGYVDAARVAGARPTAILFRHLVPNTLGPLIVVSAYALSGSILLGAGLGFLGLGAQPPAPEWGSMLSTARGFLAVAPWMALFPGLFIVLASLGANLLGDALQDWLDPQGLSAREGRR